VGLLKEPHANYGESSVLAKKSSSKSQNQVGTYTLWTSSCLTSAGPLQHIMANIAALWSVVGVTKETCILMLE